jgi:hypothetical protein
VSTVNGNYQCHYIILLLQTNQATNSLNENFRQKPNVTFTSYAEWNLWYAGRTAVMLQDFREAVFRTKYGVGERPRVGSVVEKQFNQWFRWMSKVQDKSSNESGVMPGGYQTLPFGG